MAVREAVNQVIELSPQLGLSHFEFRVLLYLADRLNAKTGQLNPSPERLAIDCGLNPKTSERTVRRIIDRLVAKRLVEEDRDHRGGRLPGGRYPTKHYRLRVDSQSPLADLVREGAEPPLAVREGAEPPLNGEVTTVREGWEPGEGGLGARVRGGCEPPEPGKLEPGKKNLPAHSVRRVDATKRASTALSLDERWKRMAEAVQEVDPEAISTSDHRILLSGYRWLTNIPAVRAFLRDHPAYDGEWPPW